MAGSSTCVLRAFLLRPRILNLNTIQKLTTEVKNEPENEVEQKPRKETVKVVPLETSLRYMESSAYKDTYGEDPVWKQYRRNFKGSRAPRKTRKTCIRAGLISTGNPCPICRDEYLVIDCTNVKLINQFICPITGKVLDVFQTGVCRKRQSELQVAIIKAFDRGYITFEVPHRSYKYEDYYPK